jgi:hypothetical protein
MAKAWFTMLILIFSFTSFSDDEVDVDNEIIRIKKELKQTQKEHKKVRAAVKQDKKEFDEYKKRTQARFRVLAAETDSIRKEVGKFNKKSAGLGSVLSQLDAKQKEYDLRQRHLQGQLISFCDEAAAFAKTAPPLLSQKAGDGIDFLKSELAVGSINNSEGAERLVKILNDLDLQFMNVEIAQGASPVPQIQGNVYRLRIGGVFEASVDTKGDKCAVWSGDRWVFIDDAAVASQILEAVMIREGKALPAFVRLPFSVAKEGGTNEK